jgi:hypothetical protein
MAFATVEDVATAQRKSVDAEDAATVEYLLDVATEMIRGYCNQHITLVEDDEVVLRSEGGKTVLLPELPVVDVTSVEYEDDAIVLDTDYELWDNGIIRSLGTIWRYPLTVVYSHGYATIPDDIRGICVDVVKRAFENPAGLQRDDLNTASQWLGFTAENKAVLDRRYKLP